MSTQQQHRLRSDRERGDGSSEMISNPLELQVHVLKKCVVLRICYRLTNSRQQPYKLYDQLACEQKKGRE
jgi:hypothetical protein